MGNAEEISFPVGRTIAVVVTGGRHWEDRDSLFQLLNDLKKLYSKVVLFQGNCPTGADLFARSWARVEGVETRTFPADWSLNGRAAGPIRNGEMAEAAKNCELDAAVCLAFWDGYSRGTLSCITECVKRGIEVHIPQRR